MRLKIGWVVRKPGFLVTGLHKHESLRCTGDPVTGTVEGFVGRDDWL